MNDHRARRLHIGSGDVPLAGWTNIDLLPYPNVDLIADVTRPLPFENVQFVFAEHFIEHLAFDDAAAFLRECRRILSPQGVLRLSTPNLDWVWSTQYHCGEWTTEDAAIQECFNLNRGFYGWGHRFLYNSQTLTALLHSAGFRTVELVTYGESRHPELRDLERHERSQDTPELPHVIIAEAEGIGTTLDLAVPYAVSYRRDTNLRWHALQYAALGFLRLGTRFLRAIGLK
ncbi:MAG TPA: methyltransferase domain-containing protein [Thermoanaerobaculia bacterium]|nr:methyltransferase domain-containing protein [Thermoanaerobaculia bacterium]